MNWRVLFTIGKLVSYILIVAFLWQGNWLRALACFVAAYFCEQIEECYTKK